MQEAPGTLFACGGAELGREKPSHVQSFTAVSIDKTDYGNPSPLHISRGPTPTADAKLPLITVYLGFRVYPEFGLAACEESPCAVDKTCRYLAVFDVSVGRFFFLGVPAIRIVPNPVFLGPKLRLFF